MRVTEGTVERERRWVAERADVIVPLANDVRAALGDAFGVSVDAISHEEYRNGVEEVFEEMPRAMNVAALIALLRDLDIVGDYPGFVIDEYLGKELAAMIAGEQPLRLLGEATFHFADIYTHEGEAAGQDDLDAALAAGFQTRLPGWSWRESRPFGRG